LALTGSCKSLGGGTSRSAFTTVRKSGRQHWQKSQRIPGYVRKISETSSSGRDRDLPGSIVARSPEKTGAVRFDSVPRHHVFSSLQPSKTASSSQLVPKTSTQTRLDSSSKRPVMSGHYAHRRLTAVHYHSLPGGRWFSSLTVSTPMAPFVFLAATTITGVVSSLLPCWSLRGLMCHGGRAYANSH
jgi:hypothetical protein